ncbi:hypothetical protein R6Q57_029885 [Mikania cordata]
MNIKKGRIDMSEMTEFLNRMVVEKPLLPVVIPLLLVLWSVEKWVFNLSNWVPLVIAVWATIQYGSYRQRIAVQDLNRKWKQLILQTTHTTPLEHCEWLNKLLIEIWPNFIGRKLTLKFSSIVEKRLKHRKPKLIEKIELLEFSLGSCPPILGMHGVQWSTIDDQRFIRMGFDWDTTDISIMLLAKLTMGTARIVVNNVHFKGDLLLSPILDGKAILYSFVSTPEVRIGVAFGSGGSQSLPATEVPGVSSWLVKLCNDSLNKTMVEPRRRCLYLPAVDLRKKAVGGVLHVTVVTAGQLSRNSFKGRSRTSDENSVDNHNDTMGKDFHTFVEVELEDLTRRTLEVAGPNPTWDSTFNMVLHDDAGILKFNLYECFSNSLSYYYLASCEIKLRYCNDDSTIFWAVGPESSVIAKHAEFCGKEVEMVVPFEGINSAKLKVKLTLKEWQFSDGLRSLSGSQLSTRGSSLYGSTSNFQPGTGRKIYVTVVEGKDLLEKEKSGKSYVKLQYGKTIHRTRSAANSQPTWNQKFDFEEISDGEYLKIKCYNEDMFGDENIGGARVNLEGLIDGVVRDVWIPLEKVNKGEVRLEIEMVTIHDYHQGSHGGLIELVLIEGRDLVAADIRGTSDPYVRVRYGNLKRRTKVMYKTLAPQWHQTFEFPDDGSLLALHVKDHNALLPTSSIGDCIVEYQRLPPNEMSDKWIPLQGVKRGEIHVQVTRKVPELQKKVSDSEPASSRGQKVSTQMKQTMMKIRSLIEDENLEEASMFLNELENLHEVEEECITQLETEQMLLLNKINELGQEIINSSPRNKIVN